MPVCLRYPLPNSTRAGLSAPTIDLYRVHILDNDCYILDMGGDAHTAAVDFLRRYISEHRLTSGSYLPGMRELSARSGFSLVVIHRAVATLSQDGILRTMPGRGTVVQVDAVSPAAVTTDGVMVSAERPPRRKWEWVAYRLRRRLVDDRFSGTEAFPTASELQQEFAVNYRTVKKALDALCAEGLLAPCRHGYRVPDDRVSSGTHALVLIARVHERLPLEFLSERSLVLLRELEQYCNRKGINLVLVKYDFLQNRLRPQDPAQFAALRRRPDVLGYIIWTLGLDDLNVPRLAQSLASADTPVGILDALGRDDLEGIGDASRPVRVLGLSLGRRHGEILAEYLIRKGHRRVAFLSERLDWGWSRNRLNGMLTAFRRYGLDDAVLPVEIGSRAVGADRMKQIRSVYLTLAPARELRGRPRVRDAIDTFNNKVKETITYEDFASEATPVLENLLADESITAWVGVHDATAFVCQDFLAARGVAVPGRVSLIGFDNSFESSLRKLDSYEFNLSGITATLVDFVTSPQHRGSFGRSSRRSEIDGYVVQRGSVSPPAEGT